MLTESKYLDFMTELLSKQLYDNFDHILAVKSDILAKLREANTTLQTLRASLISLADTRDLHTQELSQLATYQHSLSTVILPSLTADLD